jgi:hypothetical protein
MLAGNSVCQIPYKSKNIIAITSGIALPTLINLNHIMEVKKLVVLWMLSLSMFVFSCQKGDNKEAFYGKGSKTWRVAKETNASGKKEKLSDAEKQDMLRFNSDGSFSANTSQGNAEGNWNYDAAAKQLTLQFAGASVTETHSVVNLSDDKIRLKAGDGSEMTLEAAE